MHIVPDTDWVARATTCHTLLRDAITAGDTEVAHARESELKDVLIQAVLARTGYEEIQQVAAICASIVFLPGASE